MSSTALADPEGTLARRTRARRPTSYDFRRPNRFSREHMRSLHIVGDTFARQLSTVLVTVLGSVASASLGQVEQLTYDEHTGSMENPTDLMILAFPGIGGVGLLQLDLTVSLAAVDRLLGGTGRPLTELRPLTPIELGLTRTMYSRGLRELDYAFESLGRLETRVIRQESNPQFAQIGAPSDMVVVFTLQLRVVDARGTATLCIPCAALQPLLETTDRAVRSDRAAAEAETFTRALHRAVEHVTVGVSASFRPATLRSSEIVGLTEGDVVPLRHPVEAPLSVAVGGIPQFSAVTGRRGNRLACLIVDAQEQTES